MPPKLRALLFRWVNTMAGVVVASHMVRPGITYQSFGYLALAAFILGMLNAFVRPFLMWVSLPLMLFTLGLFTLVINGVLLFFAGWLLSPGFAVASFRQAFWGALWITLTSFVLNILTGTSNAKVKMRRGVPPSSGRPGNGNHNDDGPVIDV